TNRNRLQRPNTATSRASNLHAATVYPVLSARQTVMNRLASSIACCVARLAVVATATSAFAAGPTAEHIEFFEKRIRPLLQENCYECHSKDAKKIKGGLRLDSREGWEKG